MERIGNLQKEKIDSRFAQLALIAITSLAMSSAAACGDAMKPKAPNSKYDAGDFTPDTNNGYDSGVDAQIDATDTTVAEPRFDYSVCTKDPATIESYVESMKFQILEKVRAVLINFSNGILTVENNPWVLEDPLSGYGEPEQRTAIYGSADSLGGMAIAAGTYDGDTIIKLNVYRGGRQAGGVFVNTGTTSGTFTYTKYSSGSNGIEAQLLVQNSGDNCQLTGSDGGDSEWECTEACRAATSTITDTITSLVDPLLIAQ